MRINSIRLQDFRIFEDVQIELDQPLSIFKGANHQGKSSIAQAIKLALSKSCDGTDPRGAGANDKIRLGANKAIITLGIPGQKGDVELRVSYGPNKQGRQQHVTSSPAEVAESFARFIEANSERLSCVLDTDYFMAPKTDQKGILAALVLPSEYEFDAEMVALADKHLGNCDWTRNPVQIIDEVYGGPNKGAYGARTNAKAAFNGVHVPQKPPKPEHADRDEIQTKLYELRKKATTEAGKIKKGNSVQIGRMEQQITVLRAKLAQMDMEEMNAGASLEDWKKELLSPAALKKHEKVIANLAKAEALQKAIDHRSSKIDSYLGAQQIYRDMMADPICPTCTQQISKPFVEGKVREYDVLIEADSAEQQSAIDALKALGDVAGSQKAVADHHTAEAHVKGAQDRIECLKKERGETDEEIAKLCRELGEAKAADAEPADTSVLDGLNGEIQLWESRLGPAVQYQATLAQIEKAAERRTAVSKDVGELERLCAYFGKDGIKAALVAKHVAEFTETVNSVLSHWGYEARLDLESGEFEVLTPNGWLPVKEVSGSEGMFFRIGLQTAIAVHSGLKIVVVDKVDTMINGERNRAFQCLHDAIQTGQLHKAILMVADNSDTAPKKDGVAVYRVQDGKVEKL